MTTAVVVRERSRAKLVDQFGSPVASFTGASRDRRALRAWHPSGGSANADLLPALGDLRNRSEDAYRNHPLGAGAIRKNVTSIVGTGIQPRPHIDREILGLTQEQEQQWERQALRIYRLHAQQMDFTRHQDATGLQQVVLRGVLGRGDILVVRRFRQRKGDLLGTKVQLIEGDRVCNPHFTADTDRLAGGVEINGDGAVVAVHVLNGHPGDRFLRPAAWTWSRVPVWGQATGERLAVLLFQRERPEQVRGVPYLTPILELLKQISRYTDAEIMRAVVQSLLTVFVKSEKGESTFAGLDDEQHADDAASDLRLGHGLVVDLAAGESIDTVTPSAPNPNMEKLFDVFLHYAGAALEMPGEMWISKFTHSYSAARAAFIEAWKYFRARRSWLASGYCQLTYDWAITEAVARGLLEAPGFFADPLIRAAWLRVRWRGDAAGQIHPHQEIAAAAERVKLGVSSIEEEAAELRGNDFWEVHEQRDYEHGIRVDADLEAENTPTVRAPARRRPAGDDPAADLEGDETEPPDESGDGEDAEDVRTAMESYGVAVRSGAVTPQAEDEEMFRRRLGLPAMSPPVRDAWSRERTRRPVTLAAPTAEMSGDPVDPTDTADEAEQPAQAAEVPA